MRPFVILKNVNRIKVGRGLRHILILILVLMINSTSFGQTNDEYYSESKESGIRFINFTAITAGTGNHGSVYGIKLINGAQFTSRFVLGLGLGYDKYSKSSVVPLYIDLRFFPGFQRDEATFFFADIGYSLNSEDIFKDTQKAGLYFIGGGGIIFLIRDTTGITLDVGYKIQRMSENWDRVFYYPNRSYSEGGTNHVNYKSFTLSAGITF